ncbi:efflux RND transporter permease subunit [Pedobacter foliorum]|uniref:efflux RND transporter permease subunit n=1 Tax=Pedobacter foliorum TaxID=2739058 RepID=UPI001FE27DED|nr:efflux RND transporter permease subunit [Pedobacter foliorum]
MPLIPVKLSPSGELPRITVSFAMPQSSARVVEMEATSKLEAMLLRLKGVGNIYSVSSNGWGSITLELDKHTPVDLARFEISTIIRQTWSELSDEVSYPSISVDHPDSESARPFMSYTVNSVVSPNEIHSYVENVIKNKLSTIQGIFNIEVSGARSIVWEVKYDDKQLKVYKLASTDLENAIQSHYRKSFLGVTKTDRTNGSDKLMRVLFRGSDDERFNPASITVINKEGISISLDRLVSVVQKEELPSSYYRVNGLNSIYINLTSSQTANQLRLSEEVKKVMAEICKIKNDVFEVNLVYDATTNVSHELGKIYLRVALSVLSLLVLIFLIKRSFLHLFLVATSMIVNFLCACVFYYLLKLEIHLYTLAAITISLTIIVDNVIMMSAHIVQTGNRRIFLAIMTSGITIIGGLSLIYTQNESFILNFIDFAKVITVNIVISLLLVLFYVPAFLESFSNWGAESKKNELHGDFTIKKNTKITLLYKRIIYFLNRKKKLVFLFLLLTFGLPVFLIPDKIEGDNGFARIYNKIFDDQIIKDKIRPVINKVLGGTLRLFVENVPNKTTFIESDGNEVLKIVASMPSGTTIDQINEMVGHMEEFLTGFKEIKQFQTRIAGARQASIDVIFTQDCLKNRLQYFIKNRVIDKALAIGGGSWQIYGIDNQVFSNDVRLMAGMYGVILSGYNYDELTAWGDSLSKRFLTHRRIKKVSVNPRFLDFPDDYEEYYFDLNKQQLAANKMSARDFFISLNASNMGASSEVININGSVEKVVLLSQQYHNLDLWSLKKNPNNIKDRTYVVESVSRIKRQQIPKEILKLNQRYQLFLQFDYTGSNLQAESIMKEEISDLSKRLPLGYSVEKYVDWRSDIVVTQKYQTLFLLILIMFSTTAILFNSVSQALSLVVFVPISYIGVFLTFYLFHLDFNGGGMVSLFIVTVVAVNSCIYIIDEINRQSSNATGVPILETYFNVWNSKIVPILLTFLSTILGFVPYLLFGDYGGFWFVLAVGIMGGLITAIFAIVLFLPLFLVGKK